MGDDPADDVLRRGGRWRKGLDCDLLKRILNMGQPEANEIRRLTHSIASRVLIRVRGSQ